MTFAHDQANTMHRRLERHRRQRIAADEHLTARSIRDAVEKDQFEKRLLFGSDSDSTDTTGGSTTGGSNTGSGSNSSGGTTGGNTNTGNTGGTTEDTGNDAATTTPNRGATTTPRTTEPTTTRTSTTSTSTLTPTTTSSSSSSSSSTRTSSSSSSTTSSTRSSRTSSEIDTSSATSATDLNSLATSVRVITQSPTQIASATATSSSTSDGPGAGPIIGIVAGALAGIVLLAAAVSYLVKWYANRKTVDPYEANPFDRDDFRRQSAMIPDGFDSDDGHPSLVEHNNYGPGGYEDEMTMANSATAASLAGGAAIGGAAVAASSHNDSGRPRPPTMFARHADAHAPSVGAVFNQPPVVPQLPPMALGGGDPYSLAGVAGGMHNVSNPYAHLDRENPQNRFSPDQSRQQHPYNVGNVYQHYGQPQQGGLERNGSNGSGSDHRGATTTSPESYARRLDHGDEQNHRYETSGRPGTAEGRSGTPDIPNVQQTYALGAGTEDGHDVNGDGHNTPGSGRQSGLDYYSHDRPASAQQQARGSWSPPQLFSDHARSQDDEYFQQMQQQYGSSMSRPESVGASQGLQVRNLTGAASSHNGQLLPNPHGQQRPHSTASSLVEDDDAAYGGVY